MPKPPAVRRPTARRRTRPGERLARASVVVGVLLALAAVAANLAWSPFAVSRPAVPRGTDAAPTPHPTPLAPLRFRATTVTVTTDGFVSWALLDRRTGQIWGSTNLAATSWPASMIKGWISADYLRRLVEAGKTPTQSQLNEVSDMIRDSDNDAAEDVFDAIGRNDSLHRLVALCKLTDTTVDPRGWGFLNISARDTVRMAACLADGTAAGPQWTAWLLDRMRTVSVGDFGIREALPAPEAAMVAIKNGWLAYDDDGMWHINCMAVTDTWAMAVLQRFGQTDTQTFDYGEATCQNVATQLLNPAYPAE